MKIFALIITVNVYHFTFLSTVWTCIHVFALTYTFSHHFPRHMNMLKLIQSLSDIRYLYLLCVCVRRRVCVRERERARSVLKIEQDWAVWLWFAPDRPIDRWSEPGVQVSVTQEPRSVHFYFRGTTYSFAANNFLKDPFWNLKMSTD